MMRESVSTREFIAVISVYPPTRWISKKTRLLESQTPQLEGLSVIPELRNRLGTHAMSAIRWLGRAKYRHPILPQDAYRIHDRRCCRCA